MTSIWFRRAATAIGALLLATGLAAASAQAPAAADIGIVGVGGTPNSIAVDPDTDTAYVAIGADGDVPVINLAAEAETTTITVGLDSTSISVAVDPATDRIYVLSRTGGAYAVNVIDGTTNRVTATIALSASAAAGLAVDPTTNRIYVGVVPASGGCGVAVIDGSSNTVTGTISGTGTTPQAVAVNQATDTVYEGCGGSDGTVLVINGASNSLTRTIAPSGTPEALAVDPTNNTFYVSTGGGTVTAYNGATDAVSWTAATGGVAVSLAVNPDSGAVFTATQGSTGIGNFSLIDPATHAVAGTIQPGTQVEAVDYDSVTGTLVATVSSAKVLIATLAAPSFTSAPDVATFTIGTADGVTFAASGTPGPLFSESGALPAGVTLNANGGLSGTPAAGTAGTYRVTITASNGVAPAVTHPFILTVQAASGSPPPTGGTAAVAVGVEGGDGALWAQAPQLGSGWHSLAGKISAPPAVAAAPNPNGTTPAGPLFVATTPGAQLWIRSLTAGWKELGPSGGKCVGAPAAAVTGTTALTVTVACRGLNNALWETSAPWSGTGLPAFTSWHSLGGILSAGPAVAPVGGTLTFFGRGTNGRIYTRTFTAGWSQTPWACIGSPAAAAQAATGITIFACEGTNHALWEATSTGSGWSLASRGGALVAGPAVAAASGLPELYGEGTNHALWRWTSTGGWTTLGGTLAGGVGATALN